MERTLSAMRPNWRPLRWILVGSSWVVLAIVVLWITVWAHGLDARVYWDTAWPPTYSGATYLEATYNYSPAFALWVQPLTLVPWPIFHLLVVGVELGALAWLVGAPWAALLVLVQAPLIFPDVTWGNVHLLTTVLIVLGLRYPALWAFPLLTKVTPAIGLVWFAARAEWRSLAIAAIVTLLLAAPSLIFAPGAWVDWFGLLTANAGASSGQQPVPLGIRALVALAVIVWGARTDRARTVPIGVAIVAPLAMGWLAAFGAIPAWRQRQAIS